MLTITKLVSAEYLISSVADGVEDYFMGAGEAPGVWQGRWSGELGLEGVVEAEALRALIEGRDPRTGEDLLPGRPARKVRAFDLTFSCPKSVSLLWAFASPEVAAQVSIAQVEATASALGFFESKAAVARQQVNGVRRRVATHGLVVAGFVHRTSRDGDPQLHTHCLVPNLVRRADGSCVALDGNAIFEWAKAAGTIFQSELERLLTQRLGVEWGPERNGTREMVGFTRDQLRAFSKRTAAIEARLEAAGEVAFESKRDRMRADDRAALATRERKNNALTPERLRARWSQEAAAVGIGRARDVESRVVGRQRGVGAAPSREEVFAALVDPLTGLCAHEPRFGEAHVVERIAAISGGRLSVERITELTGEFLASDLVVRLASEIAPGQRRPPEWSTLAHRRLEDHVLRGLQILTRTPGQAVDPTVLDVAIRAEARPLSDDQAVAVRVLCEPGPALRSVIAPAGYGKTTAVHAAALASANSGRRVLGLATTNKAVAELRAAGVEATTIARFALDLGHGVVAPDTILVLDEVSQVCTYDARLVLDAIVGVPGVQLWCLGDTHQAQSVRAGGLATEVERLGHEGVIGASALTTNHRQHDPHERAALERYRAGDLAASQTIRTLHGWEHELASTTATRDALARTATADADAHGADHVAVLAVSHADCEDLADRIRTIRTARGEFAGSSISGPGWGPHDRVYAVGDRVLLHTRIRHDGEIFHRGSTGEVTAVADTGLTVAFDDSRTSLLPKRFVTGVTHDGDPNLSHGWARTVDGAQGGTWHQVHLLGSDALNHYTGYVGQSRGRLPTHTWNVAREPAEFTGIAADDRSGADQVLAAMGREPVETFAARDDPGVLDRALLSERADHEQVIATRPPDVRRDLARARDQLRRAQWDLDGARAFQNGATQRRDVVRPWTKLRRHGRDTLQHREGELARAIELRQGAGLAVTGAETKVRELQARDATRRRWDYAHGWRIDRIAAIDGQLRHHWANAVLSAARQDDPLAYGHDRLRDARDTFAADLRRLDNQRSDGPSPAVRRALAQLGHELPEPPDLGDAASAQRAEVRSALRTLDSALAAIEPPGPSPGREPVLTTTASTHLPPPELGLGLEL